jgi:hypothetical protein
VMNKSEPFFCIIIVRSWYMNFRPSSRSMVQFSSRSFFYGRVSGPN